MNDRPTSLELIAAARQCLENELIPALTDARLRFQALIAANVLAIVERELGAESQHLLEEWQILAKLMQLPDLSPHRVPELRDAIKSANAQLCAAIRAGGFDEAHKFESLANSLRPVIACKLAVANPKYLASFMEEQHG